MTLDSLLLPVCSYHLKALPFATLSCVTVHAFQNLKMQSFFVNGNLQMSRLISLAGAKVHLGLFQEHIMQIQCVCRA